MIAGPDTAVKILKLLHSYIFTDNHKIVRLMGPNWATLYLQFVESLHLCMFRGFY
jgi:hypothetical protein